MSTQKFGHLLHPDQFHAIAAAFDKSDGSVFMLRADRFGLKFGRRVRFSKVFGRAAFECHYCR